MIKCNPALFRRACISLLALLPRSATRALTLSQRDLNFWHDYRQTLRQPKRTRRRRPAISSAADRRKINRAGGLRPLGMCHQLCRRRETQHPAPACLGVQTPPWAASISAQLGRALMLTALTDPLPAVQENGPTASSKQLYARPGTGHITYANLPAVNISAAPPSRCSISSKTATIDRRWANKAAAGWRLLPLCADHDAPASSPPFGVSNTPAAATRPPAIVSASVQLAEGVLCKSKIYLMAVFTQSDNAISRNKPLTAARKSVMKRSPMPADRTIFSPTSAIPV